MHICRRETTAVLRCWRVRFIHDGNIVRCVTVGGPKKIHNFWCKADASPSFRIVVLFLSVFVATLFCCHAQALPSLPWLPSALSCVWTCSSASSTRCVCTGWSSRTSSTRRTGEKSGTFFWCCISYAFRVLIFEDFFSCVLFWFVTFSGFRFVYTRLSVSDSVFLDIKYFGLVIVFFFVGIQEMPVVCCLSVAPRQRRTSSCWYDAPHTKTMRTWLK